MAIVPGSSDGALDNPFDDQDPQVGQDADPGPVAQRMELTIPEQEDNGVWRLAGPLSAPRETRPSPEVANNDDWPYNPDRISALETPASPSG